MPTMPTMQDEVFVDTAYAIALAVSSDQLHQRAYALSEQIELRRPRLVTTRGVLLEIGNALSKRRNRASGVKILAWIEADPTIENVTISADLYAKAFDLYSARSDKDRGLIDCVSFVVMDERGIAEALTADQHFEQAGFRALLLGS
jgi:predicted nucleic acid-binding protein